MLIQGDGLALGWRMGAKAAVLLAFAGLMLALRFFEPRELAFIRGVFRRPLAEQEPGDIEPGGMEPGSRNLS
jgi:hypothetical protein